MLAAAQARVVAAGATTTVSLRQVHGPLVDRLVEIEPSVRLPVMGRRGAGARGARAHLGSNLERVVRARHRPLLVVLEQCERPQSMMLAFDNSASKDGWGARRLCSTRQVRRAQSTCRSVHRELR